MKIYIIVHKPTGARMPARMFHSNSRGWSYWIPGDTVTGCGGYEPHPRIFFTPRSAQNALSAWLQGPWERQTMQEGDWETGYYTVDAPPAPGIASVPRVRADMAIESFDVPGLDQPAAA